MESIEFRLNECYRFIRSNFKCERCARCCICINPIVITQKEAQEISKKEKKTVSEFINGFYIKKNEGIFPLLRLDLNSIVKQYLEEKVLIKNISLERGVKTPVVIKKD